MPVIAPTSGNSATKLHHDQIGSIRMITDAAGSTSTATTTTWDSYGNNIGTTGTLTSPFGYAGQYTDPETGLVYLHARYYDPSTGQFLTVDPLVQQTQQPYRYANANPLNETDPSGLLTVGGCWTTSGTALAFFGDLSVCGQVSSSGDVGVTATGGLGPGGVGGDLITGPSVEVSSASHIRQLGGLFIRGGAGGAYGLGAFGSGFASPPGSCNPVYGGSIGPAVGLGAGGYLGASETVTASFNPVRTWEHFVSGLAQGLASLNPFG
jgi:RHS repeat-associated protein